MQKCGQSMDKMRRYRSLKRDAIETALAEGKPRSARQIRTRVQNSRSVSWRTVRGYLYQMVQQGRLTRLHPCGAAPLYVLTESAHGSWFLCRGCQRINVLDQDRPLSVVVGLCWRCEKRREEAMELSSLMVRSDEDPPVNRDEREEAATFASAPVAVAAETEAPAAVTQPDPEPEPARQHMAEMQRAAQRDAELAREKAAASKPKPSGVRVPNIPLSPPPPWSPGPDPRNWDYNPNRDWNRPVGNRRPRR